MAAAKRTPDPERDAVVERLIRWAESRADVRALILTSTRANPEADVDAFSDYDVIVVVTDVRPYYDDRNWLEAFGRVLVRYRDPMYEYLGCLRFASITQYESGLKIDFTIWPAELLRRVVGEPLPDFLDVGYSVLVDKDGLTGGLAAPTRAAYVPTPPGQRALDDVVEEFLHEATYVAKHLRRGDLLPAKYNLDHAMKHDNLRLVLEWRVAVGNGWSRPARAYGKSLMRRLPAGIREDLAATYVGPGIEENWEALFRTVALFRRVAEEVAESLGLEYPRDLDRRVCEYLGRVRDAE